VLHECLLTVELLKQLHFLLLFLLELDPELLLDALQFAMGQLKELLRGDLLLLVEVAPQLELLLDVADGVLEVLDQLLHLGDLGLRVVLEHLDLVARVVLEAVRAQGHAVVQAEVDELPLVFRAIVAIAVGVVHGAHVISALGYT